MKKYWSVFNITLQEAFTYRLNFVMWRVRQIFVFLISFFIWRAVLGGGGEVYGYEFGSIMTYLFGTTILRSVVMGSRTVDLGWMINSGYLTIPLLKPIGIFRFFAFRDLADKFYNLSFIIFEIPLMLLLFHPPVFLQSNPYSIFMFVCSVSLAVLIYFYINILFGSIAFWSREVWAPRFVLMVVMEFATGSMFPLDMLPSWGQKIIYLTPFPHLLFSPLQIYLGKVNNVFSVLGIEVFWVIMLYITTRFVWGRGLHSYEAEGR